jgi:hypothetical protein
LIDRHREFRRPASQMGFVAQTKSHTGISTVSSKVCECIILHTNFTCASVFDIFSDGELRSCDVCPSNLIRVPMRAKYCNASQKVVARFDHHCPFVNNTVGASNHKYFIGFLISVRC